MTSDQSRTPDESRIASLDVLARQPQATTGWSDADAIKHTIRRRRQARGAGAVLVAAAIAAAVVAPQLGSGGPRPAPPTAAGNPHLHVSTQLGAALELVAAHTGHAPAADTSAEAQVAQAEQAFSIALLKAVNSSSGSNESVSPTSLAIALSMLQNGAQGSTLSEIKATLRSSGLSTATQDAGWAALVADWSTAAAKDKTVLESANSIWTQRGLPLRAAFMAALARYYNSGVWQVDFGHNMAGALAALNAWTSKHTHGRIKQLFDQLDPATVLVLANAVYFKAAWQESFDQKSTTAGPFTLGSGKTVQAQFMSSTGQSPTLVSIGTGYQAAELPYHGGRFAALAIMPTSGSLSEFTDALTPASLQGIVAKLVNPGALNLYLPRFTTTSKTDLVPVLSSLGMAGAFGGSADFGGLSPVGLQLAQAIQRVYLKVDEKGTVAAAATGISLVPTALAANPLTIRFDHPFLFMIRDTKTGAILFTSQINDPTAG
jgi:serpin B